VIAFIGMLRAIAPPTTVADESDSGLGYLVFFSASKVQIRRVVKIMLGAWKAYSFKTL